MKSVYRFTIGLALFSTVASAADKPQYQSLQSIRNAAEAFLQVQNQDQDGEIDIIVNNLDRRLRLRQCSQPLQGFLSPGSQNIGRTSVGVRCEDEHPWSIYVTAKVDIRKPVVVTIHAIPRGIPIRAEDLTLEPHNIADLRLGYLESMEQAIGNVPKQNIAAGRILTRQTIAAPKIVHRGELVTILSENPNFSIRMAGKALADGSKGNRIRVENTSSKRIIEAEITGPGIVSVSL